MIIFFGDITFQRPTDYPVRDELQNIEIYQGRFTKVDVIVDGGNCLAPLFGTMPTIPNRAISWTGHVRTDLPSLLSIIFLLPKARSKADNAACKRNHALA
jgi:hypothetical protein